MLNIGIAGHSIAILIALTLTAVSVMRGLSASRPTGQDVAIPH
jgi:hypothetical protein